jgi:hypothetical protein
MLLGRFSDAEVCESAFLGVNAGEKDETVFVWPGSGFCREGWEMMESVDTEDRQAGSWVRRMLQLSCRTRM